MVDSDVDRLKRRVAAQSEVVLPTTRA
jgi:hypothetical protein